MHHCLCDGSMGIPLHYTWHVYLLLILPLNPTVYSYIVTEPAIPTANRNILKHKHITEVEPDVINDIIQNSNAVKVCRQHD